MELAAAIVGALLGAIAALVASLYIAREADRRNSTAQVVAEFLSDEFLAHRISVSHTRRKRDAGSVSIEEIARGYWFPGGGNSYQGDTYRDMNEHQHIEAYIGFLIRVEYLATRRRLNVPELSAVIGMTLQYHMQIMRQVAAEARRQAEEADVKVPTWIGAAEFVDQCVVQPAFR